MAAAHAQRKGDENNRPASKKKETRQIARNYDKKDRNPALPKGFSFYAAAGCDFTATGLARQPT